jgi:protein involved in polysaccharide export with SLBB domain
MNIGDYRIAPRDQVQFLVFEEPDVVVLQRVSSAGEISVPMLGAVKVAGLTLRQAESMLEKRYRDGGYYLNPQVILSFQAYAPRSISVLGQVNNPSQIDFAIERDQLGIISAITRAGGFTRVARTDSVKVMRMVEGKETSFTINVAAYLDERSKEQEFKLMPDDIVFIPERVF